MPPLSGASFLHAPMNFSAIATAITEMPKEINSIYFTTFQFWEKAKH
jgi:hypothetical protein